MTFHTRFLLGSAFAFTVSTYAYADGSPPTIADTPPSTLKATPARERLETVERETHPEREIDAARGQRASPQAYSSAALGRGSVVLPDLLGVSTIPLGLGLSPLGAAPLITGPISFGFASGDSSKSSQVALSPSMDVFATDRFTVGVRLVAARNTSTHFDRSSPVGTMPIDRTSEGYALGISPRVGYLVPITRDIALWPQFGISVSQTRMENEDFGRILQRTVGAELEAGLLFPLGRHVVARLAPTLAYSYTWADANGGIVAEDFDAVRAGVRAQLGLAF